MTGKRPVADNPENGLLTTRLENSCGSPQTKWNLRLIAETYSSIRTSNTV